MKIEKLIMKKNIVKNKHMGFTLVELLVSVAISGIVLLAVTELFITSNDMYHEQDDVASSQQEIRASLDIMSRDIRLAGLDVTGVGAGFTAANQTNLQFTYDLNGNGTLAAYTYQYDSGNKRIMYDNPNLSSSQALTKNGTISTMGFMYQLSNGTSIANPAASDLGNIRLITINICNEVEGNTYCFDNVIRPRNMGL